jgi:carbamoyltransferase
LKPTLAVYAIPDIDKQNYPVLIHDHCVAYYQNGVLTKSLHLERLTRNKYDNKLDALFLDVLKQENLEIESCDLVFVNHFAGSTFATKDGKFRFECNFENALRNSLTEGTCYYRKKRFKAYSISHELAHIYSCIPFYGQFIENSLLFHFDGGASLGNISLWRYKNKQVDCIHYGWQLKHLSSLFNANALVFSIAGAGIKDQNGAPGKFMGFSSFGQADKKILEWLKENNFFESYWKNKQPFYDSAKKHFGVNLSGIDLGNSFIQDIAATIQHYFTNELLSFLQEWKEITKCTNLYYSGGSALNIITNTAILDSELFEHVFIPPCPGDSGLAIGAGAFMEIHKQNEVKPTSVYMNNWALKNYETSYKEIDLEQIANMLMQNKIIGICNGNAEVGPRALGNRSILALANSKPLADRLSMFHKKREWYRPVAPVMLEKNAHYFTEQVSIHQLADYMLLDFFIPEKKRSELQGAVHVDNTSRVQCIRSKKVNPFLFDLLEHLDDKHNVKALLNTSFNIKGEPIVHAQSDAIKSAKSMKLDGLVINGKLIDLI